MKLAPNILLIALSLVPGCGAQDSTDQGPAYHVGGLPDLEEDAAAWADSLVRDLALRLGTDVTALDGQLYRFGGTRASPRLLLEAEHPEGENGAGVVLFVLSKDLPENLTSPYETGVVYDERNFEPLSVRDLDDDGLPDFTYCVFAKDGTSRETSVANVGGQWRVLDVDAPASCGDEFSGLAGPYGGGFSTVTEDDRCAAEREQVFEGYYVFGHEVNTFSPCTSSDTYWVVGDPAKVDSLRVAYVEWFTANQADPYAPMFAHFRGRVSNGPLDGFAEAYDGLFTVEEVRLLRGIEEGDCGPLDE